MSALEVAKFGSMGAGKMKGKRSHSGSDSNRNGETGPRQQPGCGGKGGKTVDLDSLDTATLVALAEVRFGPNWAEAVRSYSKSD